MLLPEVKERAIHMLRGDTKMLSSVKLECEKFGKTLLAVSYSPNLIHLHMRKLSFAHFWCYTAYWIIDGKGNIQLTT